LETLTKSEKQIVVQEENEIIVKNKGQITIPAKIRKKYKMDEGTHLKVVVTEDGFLLIPKKTFWDMIGAYPVDPKKKVEMDKQLYDLRHEENDQ
jgi:AbrB family looped-hinge helix DNA binding protein